MKSLKIIRKIRDLFLHRKFRREDAKRETDMIRKPHPANVPGDFYVEDGICLICDVPRHVAPDLMGMLDGDVEFMHCFFKKQPETPEEIKQAIEAIQVSCCAGLRYAGNDSSILTLLKAKGCVEQCDTLTKFR